MYAVSITCNIQSCHLFYLQFLLLAVSRQKIINPRFHYLQLPTQNLELLPASIMCHFNYLHIPSQFQIYLLFLVLALSVSKSLLSVSSTYTFPSASLICCFWYLHIQSQHAYFQFPVLPQSPSTALLAVSGTCTFSVDIFSCCFHYLQLILLLYLQIQRSQTKFLCVSQIIILGLFRLYGLTFER